MNALRRATLFVAGLVAVAIGAAILLAPVAFHWANGIELTENASLLSELRAPGGALVAAGALIILGAFVARLAFTAAAVGALLYLGYGLARVLSIVVDGAPAGGLIVGMAVELALGVACAFILGSLRRDPPAAPA
jgi:hypothetical protein